MFPATPRGKKIFAKSFWIEGRWGKSAQKHLNIYFCGRQSFWFRSSGVGDKETCCQVLERANVPKFNPFQCERLFWSDNNSVRHPWDGRKKNFRPISSLVLSCCAAIRLPPAKDYNLILNRVISLKAHSKHSLKVQDLRYVSVSAFISRPPSFTAWEGFQATE